MGRRSGDVFLGVVVGAAAATGVSWGLGSGSSGGRDRAVEPGGSAQVAAADRPAYDAVGGAPGQDGPTDGEVQRVRAGMARRAWTRPVGENVRELLAALAQRSADDATVAALHTEAAERVLADAVGLDHAGRRDAARDRVRLALAWAPELPGAQAYFDELGADAGAASASASVELAPLPTRAPGVASPAAREPAQAAPAPGAGDGLP